MEDWIRTSCSKVSRRRLITWLLVAMAGILLVVSPSTYWKNFFHGPYTVTPTEFSALLTNINHPRFVSITGDHVSDTGLQELTRETRNGVSQSHVTGGYYALALGDRFLLVKASRPPGLTVTGALEPIPTDVSDKIFTGPNAVELRSTAYPVYLSTESYRFEGTLGIGLLVLLSFLLWKYAIPAARSVSDVTQHPVVKRVEGWGGPSQISALAYKEWSGSLQHTADGVTITTNFVIYKTFFHFSIYRFDDLLWAYKKTTQHKGNSGKTFEAVLEFIGGCQIYNAEQVKVNELLSFAARRAPWAVIGYSEEIAKVFYKTPQAFLSTVAARR